MGSISLLASNCIIFGWITLTCLTLTSFILLSYQAHDSAEEDSLLPKNRTWWLFLFWFLANLLTWKSAVLIPAKTFTHNIEAVTPPRCCYCMTKPGGLMLMRFHYFMSAGTVIIGIACGVDSDLRTTRTENFGEEPPLDSDSDSGAALDDRETRFSGILPTNVSRGQVAKFRLDHHKMIYKEKRRQSMPAIPRLSDIPEASESGVSSRNVSKLSSSYTDFPGDTLGS